RNFNRPAPAAQEIPAEGQKAARALSEAFEAVADYVRPSVVQIRVEKKTAGLGDLFGGGGGRNAPFRFFGDPNDLNPKELKDLLKRMHPELKDEDLDRMLKQFTPDRGRGGQRKGQRQDPKPRVEKNQFGFRAEGTGSGFVYDDKGH